ncbi:unnamed protein product [Amoebophrya sp. A120]|nr:unnamed protein product [Amoebophrya sp. A120]|eukprot:GSA120T00016906001.1
MSDDDGRKNVGLPAKREMLQKHMVDTWQLKYTRVYASRWEKQLTTGWPKACKDKLFGRGMDTPKFWGDFHAQPFQQEKQKSGKKHLFVTIATYNRDLLDGSEQLQFLVDNFPGFRAIDTTKYMDGKDRYYAIGVLIPRNSEVYREDAEKFACSCRTFGLEDIWSAGSGAAQGNKTSTQVLLEIKHEEKEEEFARKNAHLMQENNRLAQENSTLKRSKVRLEQELQKKATGTPDKKRQRTSVDDFWANLPILDDEFFAVKK